MSSLARTPARWNPIWLGGALVAVVVLGTAAVRFGGLAGREGPAPRTAAVTGAVIAAPHAVGSRRGISRARYLSGVPAVAVSRDGRNGAGSCWLGPVRAPGRYVRLPRDRFAGGAACGSYLLVQGRRGIVRAEVVGLCRRCAPYMINLSPAAFRAAAGHGRAPVTYWPEANPPLPGPIALRVGRTRTGLVTLQVRNNGNPLAGVAVGQPRIRLPLWRAFRRNAHGVWVGHDRLGPGPFEVRITDDLGHRVMLPRVILVAGRTVRTRQWMYRHR